MNLPEVTTSKSPADGMNWHVNGVSMTMLGIPAGDFVRRDSSAGDDAIDQTVTLTRSFLLSDSEVTRAQFQRFIDDPDCPDAEKPKEPEEWQGAATEYSPSQQHPVQQVSWYDAVLFCNWLSRKEGLTPCYERTGKKDALQNWGEYDVWRLVPEANGYRLPAADRGGNGSMPAGQAR